MWKSETEPDRAKFLLTEEHEVLDRCSEPERSVNAQTQPEVAANQSSGKYRDKHLHSFSSLS